jgi:hypothetical protein
VRVVKGCEGECKGHDHKGHNHDHNHAGHKH